MTDTRRSKRRWLLLWIISGLLVSSQGLAEDPSVARAREYFRAGAQAYSVGEYGAAIQAFEQAYALAPRPAVLFSIAQAERRQFFLLRDQQRLRRAIEMFRQYLNEETQSARKADAVQALSELEPLLAAAASEIPPAEGPGEPKAQKAPSTTPPVAPPTRLMVSSPIQGARISLDGTAQMVSPLVREVEPGEHRIRVESPGFQPVERRVTAVAGELVNVDVSLVERPARLLVVAPPDAHLSIDGRVQGKCPCPKPIELASGVHLITVSKNGFVGISREETLTRGETTVFRAPLRRSRQRTVAMFMVGAAASALTTGAIFAYISHNQEQAAQGFLDDRGHKLLTPDDLAQYNSTRVDRDRIRGAAWVSVGIGVGLGITSALMWIYDGSSVEPIKHQDESSRQGKRRTPSFGADPTVGPGLAGLLIHGAF
jgi:hypothetical protein